MRTRSFDGVVEDFDRADVPLVDERRMSDQDLAATRNFHEFRQFAEGPVGDALGEVLRHGFVGLRDRLEGVLREAA